MLDEQELLATRVLNGTAKWNEIQAFIDKNYVKKSSVRDILKKDRQCMELGYYSAYITLIDDLQCLLDYKKLIKKGVNMDKEIEVGEYVRTILGNITKVVAVKDTVVWTDDFIDGFGKYHEGIIKTTDIVKRSKNIIDLIEVNDYVNGEIVLKDNLDNLVICPTIISNGLYNTAETYKSKIKNIDIKSIVTKEQFKSMEYEVR